MGTDVVTKEQMKHSLDNWYRVMLQQNIEKATEMKEEIDSKISGLEVDQELSLYFTLLDFRYKMLTDWLNIKENSFERIESFEVPTEGFLAYYYHFFKGIYCTSMSKYNDAKESYEKANILLKYVSHSLENAEFDYRMGNFYYQTYQQVNAIDYLRKAKEEFKKHIGCEINIALCENAFGLCCIDLKNYELAEESFNAAMDIFQKVNYGKYILMVRHNLAFLYASQDLSELAVRHASEVTKKQPKFFKALFVEARECYKLGQYQLVADLIEKGLDICKELNKEEFQYRFMILKSVNDKSPTLSLEQVVLEGISYFEKEELWECIQEYAEMLALRFYKEENHDKASHYFYMSHKAQKKLLKKGALK
ncbi:hypothetical protein [Bacillus mycoides]|uniref:response regulator aspartate phosphatase n=1 Tax=Bacillus mycoides TaxID=1405 RepID=UPI001FB3F663|nr:hypothetical protein [Bacillus mycoides]UNP82661.1 hypothetical protein MN034_05390 [Bacillus mycoides]